jgi:hypothetical protein
LQVGSPTAIDRCVTSAVTNPVSVVPFAVRSRPAAASKPLQAGADTGGKTIETRQPNPAAAQGRQARERKTGSESFQDLVESLAAAAGEATNAPGSGLPAAGKPKNSDTRRMLTAWNATPAEDAAPATPKPASTDDKSETDVHGTDRLRLRLVPPSPGKGSSTDTQDTAPVTAPLAIQAPMLSLSLIPAPEAGSAPTGVKETTATPPTERIAASDVALEVRLRMATPDMTAEAPSEQPKTAAAAPLQGIPTGSLPVAAKSGDKPADSGRHDEQKPRESISANAKAAAGEREPEPHTEHETVKVAPHIETVSRTPEAETPLTPAAAHIQSEPPPVPVEHRGVAEPPRQSAPERPAPVASAHLANEPEPAKADTNQPLRTLSLEFAPDGASDVRLRLSEHAGEVHISLHSSDPSLSGRLHEGIHDLVGSLSTAGYDAEAWTPSQGRQQQRQPEDSPKKREGKSGSGGEVFSGILQQPVREVL